MPSTAATSYAAPTPGPFANIQGQQFMGAASPSIQPIGGNSNVELMRGLAGLVRSNEAVAQEVSNVTSQLSILSDRTFKLMGVAPSSVPGSGTIPMGGITKQDLSEAMRQGVIQAYNQMATPEGQRVGDPYELPGGPGGPGRGGSPGRGPSGPGRGPGRHPGDDGFAPPPHRSSHPEPEEPSNSDRFRQARDVGQIRQTIARQVGKRLSESGWANAAEGSGKARALGAARGVAGKLAEGGTFGEAALETGGAGLASFAGGAGLAYEVGNRVADFAENQRSQNAKWQSIMGGSNFEGFKERAKSSMFAMGQRGIMGGEDAQRLYMDVARTGLRGSSRANALDFATDAYKRFGMSVQESVQLVQLAAENGVHTFGNLTTALKGVTKAARTAGVNAEEMRQKFVQNLTAAVPNAGFTGATTQAAAQIISGSKFTHDLSSKLDYSGMNSEGSTLMQAHAAGMTPNQYIDSLGDPKQQVNVARNRDKLISRTGSMALRGLGMSILSQGLGSLGGRKPTKEDPIWDQMAHTYMQDPRSGASAMMMAKQLEQIGVTGMTPQNAVRYLMMQQAGVGSLEQSTAEAQGAAAKANSDLPGAKSTFGQANALAGSFDSRMGLGWIPGVGGASKEQMKNQHAADIYRDSASKTGRKGGISQALVSKGKFAGDRRIKVHTANGDRVVTTDDAMRYYRDQIDQGDAEIVSGTDAGKSVAEAAGLKGDSSVKVTSDHDKGLGKHGKSVGDAAKGGNKITVIASPELQRWMRFQGQGVATDPNAGNAPPNSRTTPSGLNTDSGGR